MLSVCCSVLGSQEEQEDITVKQFFDQLKKTLQEEFFEKIYCKWEEISRPQLQKMMMLES